MQTLESFFELKKHGSNVRVESLAGLTTFLAMAYIAVVNPSILSQAGMDFGAVFVATCIAAAFGSIVMGLLANYPIAQAPGMGQNAFFTFTIVLGMGHAWQTALGAVFVSGVIFVVLSVLPVREWLVNAIPRNLKWGLAAGIGLFLGFIALQNAGIIVDGHHVSAPAVRLAQRAKPPGKLYFVSDSMATVGSDLARFDLYGEPVTLVDGCLRNRECTLSGSAITLSDALRVGHREVGLPLAECLRMASLYPAAFAGTADCRGRIRRGYRADLVHLGEDLDVRAVWVGGRAI